MPRMTKAVPAYRYHRGSGQAVVSINKKVLYLGKWKSAESKAAYDRLIAEWLAARRETTSHTPPASRTVAEVILAYWKHVETYYVKNGQPTGEQGAIKLALRELRKLYGRTHVASFDPGMLQAVQAHLVSRKLALKTVNDAISRIIRMFRWAVVKRLVPSTLPQSLRELSPLKAGRSEAKETQPILPVEDAMVQQTLPFLPPVVRAMVQVQRLSGMRPQEVCDMRLLDIDRSGKVWLYRPETHKTEHKGRERVVALGPKAIAILEPYLAGRAAAATIFSPRQSEALRRAALHAARKVPHGHGNRPGSNLKRHPKRKPGDRYTAGSYRHAVLRGCERAFPLPEEFSIPSSPTLAEAEAKARRARAKEWRKNHRWTPNQLRHALATQVRSSHGLEASRITLGHSAADVTEKHYAEVDLAKLVDVMAIVG